MSDRDFSQLHPALTPYFDGEYRMGPRVRVETAYFDSEGNLASTHMRTGTVGRTTGWRPAYLIMARCNMMGSSDLVSMDRPGKWTTRVVGVQDSSGKYRKIAEPSGPWTIGHHEISKEN